jgi:hypothetical protein
MKILPTITGCLENKAIAAMRVIVRIFMVFSVLWRMRSSRK